MSKTAHAGQPSHRKKNSDLLIGRRFKKLNKGIVGYDGLVVG